ncbi:unnamed protein product [Calypogeia fissa]
MACNKQAAFYIGTSGLQSIDECGDPTTRPHPS